jgi:hypothetical protein
MQFGWNYTFTLRIDSELEAIPSNILIKTRTIYWYSTDTHKTLTLKQWRPISQARRVVAACSDPVVEAADSNPACEESSGVPAG